MIQAHGHPVDDDALEVATAHYARARDDERRASESAIVFRIGSEWLALPTILCSRVTGVQPVHSLPLRRGGAAAGLVTVDGDIVVHLSLAALLGIDPQGAAAVAPRARAAVPRLVVLADTRGSLAIGVDDVWGICAYDPARVRPVPSTLTRALVSYTSAMLEVEELLVGCLDGPRVMHALSASLA